MVEFLPTKNGKYAIRGKHGYLTELPEADAPLLFRLEVGEVTVAYYTTVQEWLAKRVRSFRASR
jgi:hypothetical protein